MLAKGARRLKSKVRGIIRPFTPLLLSWSGKGELQTLTDAELSKGLIYLNRQAWLCGSYMNELLMKLLHRHDPHEALFDNYELTLPDLSGDRQQAVLRIFEKTLLSEIGYGLQLEKDTDNRAISGQRFYDYYPDQGPVLSDPTAVTSQWQVSGATLIALAQEQFANNQTIEQSKRLMRILLHHCLQGRQLNSRKVLQSIQAHQ